MTHTDLRKPVTDLVRMMDHLRSQQERLLDVMQRKLEAMRRADTSTMQSLAEREQHLVARLERHEEARRRLMQPLVTTLGLNSEAADRWTVSQLAAHLPAPERATLLAAADTLREVVWRVQQANRHAAVVSREILNHMKWVFASVQPAAAKPAGYAGDGTAVTSATNRLFEVVG